MRPSTRIYVLTPSELHRGSARVLLRSSVVHEWPPKIKIKGKSKKGKSKSKGKESKVSGKGKDEGSKGKSSGKKGAGKGASSGQGKGKSRKKKGSPGSKLSRKGMSVLLRTSCVTRFAEIASVVWM